jgi:Flp pilus assembly protein TadB
MMAAKKAEEAKQEVELNAGNQEKTQTKKKTAVEKPVVNQKETQESAKTSLDRGAKAGNRDKGPIIFGIGMLVFGVLLLVGNLLNISFGSFLWPFIFIVPGVLVFFSAVSASRNNGEGLAIVGGIFTMLGLVFLMQTVTGFWASWAYIWALVAPTSIGLSQMFYGNIKRNDTVSRTGWNLTKIGLRILAVGFVFFELIIGLSGFGLRRLGLPIFPLILIFAGGFLLVRSILKPR